MSARMDNSNPSILWWLRSIEELLDRVGDSMADIDANKACVAYLAAMLGELGDDLDSADMPAEAAGSVEALEALEGLA
jgi:hypothetical protein